MPSKRCHDLPGPPALLNRVVPIPIHEPVPSVGKPPRQLHWRPTVARDALERRNGIDKNQHVVCIHATTQRLASDRRDAIGVYNTHIEICAGISQAGRTSRIHVTSHVAGTYPT